MRSSYLVCYDIADEKRLRKVFKTMRNYGDHIQFSVFECPLDETRLARLKAELEETINRDEDQVLFVTLGPESGDASLRIEAIGRPYTTVACGAGGRVMTDVEMRDQHHDHASKADQYCGPAIHSHAFFQDDSGQRHRDQGRGERNRGGVGQR